MLSRRNIWKFSHLGITDLACIQLTSIWVFSWKKNTISNNFIVLFWKFSRINPAKLVYGIGYSPIFSIVKHDKYHDKNFICAISFILKPVFVYCFTIKALSNINFAIRYAFTVVDGNLLYDFRNLFHIKKSF